MGSGPSGSPSGTLTAGPPQAARPSPLGRVLSFLTEGISGFIIRRALLGLFVLAAVSVVVFAATQALPGDPARAILGRSASPEALAALRDQLNLDQSVVG